MRPSLYRFGTFELDPSAAELRRSGRRIPIQEKPLLALLALLERPGELVSREALQERLWPEGHHVDVEAGINASVARLREALGDSASNPRFVATVPRRGYRFIAPVESAGSSRRRALKPGVKVKLAASLLILVGSVVARVLIQQEERAVLDEDWSQTSPLRLAVLPFDDLGQGPEPSVLSRGLTDEMISLLGRLHPERLRVIARSSTVGYRPDDRDLAEIARRLDVDYVLEGSVQREEALARVRVALVETASESVVWGAAYDRPLGSLIALESEISGDVARALALELEVQPPGTLLSEEGHRLILEGRYFLGRRQEEEMRKAVDAFERAAGLDPAAAAAHIGLARSWLYLGLHDFASRDEVRERAGGAAQRAVELDPGSAEAHVMLAAVRYFFEWRFEEAAASLERALALNPSASPSHLFAASFHAARGDRNEARAATRRALDLDPLSPATHAEGCWHLFVAGEAEEALASCRRSLELDGDFLEAWDVLKWIHIVQGAEPEAIEAFLKVVQLEQIHAVEVESLRAVAAQEGLEGLLRASLLDPAARLREVGQSPYNLALDHAMLEEPEAALDYLEQAYEQR
ncbi:MAG: winged helix-turn-helix domain-containing protein, partial [Acidobacteriota bacterium]